MLTASDPNGQKSSWCSILDRYLLVPYSSPLKLFACTMTLTIASMYCWVIFLQMAFLTIDQGIPSAIIITSSLGAGLNGHCKLSL